MGLLQDTSSAGERKGTCEDKLSNPNLGAMASSRMGVVTFAAKKDTTIISVGIADREGNTKGKVNQVEQLVADQSSTQTQVPTSASTAPMVSLAGASPSQAPVPTRRQRD